MGTRIIGPYLESLFGKNGTELLLEDPYRPWKQTDLREL